MRASLVFVGMGCLTLLLLPSALALSATPDRLTTTIRQGEVMIFHLTGAANDTLTLSTDHIGARGFATTVGLAVIKLDENGTARYAFRATGELSAVGTWEFRAANRTEFVKVRYFVDWDPVFLLEKEAANLALMRAFWTEIQTWAVAVTAALILTWSGMRLWHAWSHARPTFLWQTLARKVGRVRGIASVTEMGLQFADKDPIVYNRAMFAQQRTIARRKERALRETVERADDLLRQRDGALERAELYRRRVLTDNPGDPLVSEGVDVSAFLEAEEMRARGLVSEEDDGG